MFYPFVLDPARPLDAETYTIKGMLRKNRSTRWIPAILRIFSSFIYFFFFLAILRYLSEGELKWKKFRSISEFYRENSVSSTHKEKKAKEDKSEMEIKLNRGSEGCAFARVRMSVPISVRAHSIGRPRLRISLACK